MGLFSLFSKRKTPTDAQDEPAAGKDGFTKKLKKATLSEDWISRDEVPAAAHQRLIHEIAEHCLNDSSQTKEMFEYFDTHPLLGLEVTDEILVLGKNNPNKYRLGDKWMRFVPLYGMYSRKIDELRGGRRRRTTTPTLRGGGQRES